MNICEKLRHRSNIRLLNPKKIEPWLHLTKNFKFLLLADEVSCILKKLTSSENKAVQKSETIQLKHTASQPNLHTSKL